MLIIYHTVRVSCQSNTQSLPPGWGHAGGLAAKRGMAMALSLKESIARCQKIISDDQIIAGRSELLRRDDRVLVRAVWIDNQSTRRVASLAGVTPNCVRQRVRRIVKRIHSEDFLAAARLLPELTGRHAQVARLHFCQGLSCRAAARKTGIPYHEFRRLVDEVRGIVRLRQRRAARRRGR